MNATTMYLRDTCDKSAIAFFALLAPFAAFAAGSITFEISADKADCIYERGETVQFTVSAKDSVGELLTSGTVSYRTHATLASPPSFVDSHDLSASNPFTVIGSLDSPGFLKLDVKASDGSAASWSVAVAPELVAPTVARPADFDTYWDGEIARLNSEVPDIDVQMTLVDGKSTGSYNYYQISFATFNGARVYGFYTEPKDTSRTYPAIVTCPGAGAYHTSSWLGSGSCVSLMLNVIPISPFTTSASFQSAYDTWNANLVSTYNLQDGAMYGAAGISVSREAYVFHDIVLGMNRAVDWLAQRQLVNKTRIGYLGGSQGGAFGLMLMGLNTHFTRGAAYVPALCDNLCVTANPALAPGWPHILWKQPSGSYATAMANIPYFDGVNFASRITCPVRMAVGLIDTTCPPRGGWCAFNALASSDKSMESVPGMTHSVDASIENSLYRWVLGTGAANTAEPSPESSLQVYQIPGNVTDGIDLLGMSETYYTDRLKGRADCTIAGEVTHSPVTVERPFLLTGSANPTKFKPSTGLQNIPIRIVGGGTWQYMKEDDSTYANYQSGSGYGHLDIENGGFEAYRLWLYGNDSERSFLYVTNGCSLTLSTTLRIGSHEGNGTFVLDGGSFTPYTSIEMGTYTNKNSTASANTSVNTALVANATLNVHSGEGTIYMSRYGATSGADKTTDRNILILGENSRVSTRYVFRHNDPRGHIIFRGGCLAFHRIAADTLNYAFSSEGNGMLVIEGDGYPIHIDTKTNNLNFCYSWTGNIRLRGTGGFKKSGSGRLTLNNPEGSGNPFRSSFSGGVEVAAGTLRIRRGDLIPATNLLTVAEGAKFDMYGCDIGLTGATGAGVVTNSSSTAATLTLGHGDGNYDFSAKVGGKVSIAKTGTGTLTVSGNALTNTCDLTINAGTVEFVGESDSYGTVTVKSGAVLDISKSKFSCSNLVRNPGGRIVRGLGFMLIVE